MLGNLPDDALADAVAPSFNLLLGHAIGSEDRDFGAATKSDCATLHVEVFGQYAHDSPEISLKIQRRPQKLAYFVQGRNFDGFACKS